MSEATSPPMQSCPACGEEKLARRWTGTTEVDTFDIELGAWTEHHFHDDCVSCNWAREGVSHCSPESWRRALSTQPVGPDVERHDMAEGASFSKLRVESRAPEDWQSPSRVDVCRVLSRILEHGPLRPSPMIFKTDRGRFELEVSAIALSRAALSLRLQLDGGDVARAFLESGTGTAIEIGSHGEHHVARIFTGQWDHGVTRADTLLDAIETMWRSHGLHENDLANFLDPALGQMHAALTAGLGPMTEARCLSETPVELVRELAPTIAEEVIGRMTGTEGAAIWAGAAPDMSLPFAERLAAWMDATTGLPSAFFLLLSPGRAVFFSRDGERQAFFEESFAPSHPSGVGERLTYVWRNRTTFVDGLFLANLELRNAPTDTVPPDVPLTLHSLAGEVPDIIIEPTTNVLLGRKPHAPISVDHGLVSRRQALFSADDCGWHVTDAGSTSGTRLGGALLRERSRPLHIGDELRLGGLELLALDTKVAKASQPATTSPEPDTLATLEGECACGHVGFQLLSEPLFVHACHCSYCQRETGAPFAVNALIELDRLKVLRGETIEVLTPSASGKGQRIVRCQSCHVALWSHYAYGKLADHIAFVRVGTLANAAEVPPDIHIFTESKQAWLPLPVGVPIVAGFYRASEHWPKSSLARRATLMALVDVHARR